jgi:hypothetical protein
MMPPVKPEVCIIGDRLAVFLGADYKLMPLEVAEAFALALQRELATLKSETETAA